MQIEIKDLNRKLKEEEKNKETIHNQNLVTTKKLQKLMNGRKNKEFYDLFDNLDKNFKKYKEKSYDYFGFDRNGIQKDTGEKYVLKVLIKMVFTKILVRFIILKVLIKMVFTKILKMNIILMVLIKMVFTKILI